MVDDSRRPWDYILAAVVETSEGAAEASPAVAGTLVVPVESRNFDTEIARAGVRTGYKGSHRTQHLGRTLHTLHGLGMALQLHTSARLGALHESE